MSQFSILVYAVSLFPNLSKNLMLSLYKVSPFLETFDSFFLKSADLFKSIFFYPSLVCFGVAKVIKFSFLTSVCEKISELFFSQTLNSTLTRL